MFNLSVLTVRGKIDARNAEVPLSMNTVDGSIFARSAEVPAYANMGEKSVNARTAEAAVYANTDDGIQYARSVVVCVYMGKTNVHARSVDEVLYVSIISRSINAQIAMALEFAELTENRIIQAVEQEETANVLGSVPTASPIYSQMIRGH